jgi:hypothetical protein
MTPLDVGSIKCDIEPSGDRARDRTGSDRDQKPAPTIAA